MRFEKIMMAAMVVLVVLFVASMVVLKNSIQSSQSEFNACRDNGSSVMFCLTGFK